MNVALGMRGSVSIVYPCYGFLLKPCVACNKEFENHRSIVGIFIGMVVIVTFFNKLIHNGCCIVKNARMECLVKIVSAQTPQKNLFVRWKTLRGFSAIIGFVVIAVILESIVVAYAMSIGVKDNSVLQYRFTFPGTRNVITLGLSPLYNLVPIAVVIALVTSWIYLTKSPTVRPHEPLRTGQQPKRAAALAPSPKGFIPMLRSELLHASIRSSIIIAFAFLAFVFIASMLAFPDLIFKTIANAYANNPSLLSFIKGSGSFFAPLVNFLNGAIPVVGPGFRDFADALGRSLAPIANLDNSGKYLFFQNAAAWLSAFAVLVYGELSRRGYRYRRIR